MEETAEEVAHDTLIAGVQLHGAEIAHNRHEQHMPHHGGFRYARRLRPALLEAQLSHQVDELAALALERQLLHCGQVIMVLQLIFNQRLRILAAINALIKVIDKLKLPLRRQIMRRPQQLLLHRRIAGLFKIALHLLHKIILNIRNTAAQLLINPFVELLAVYAHHLMENRRLDVRQRIALHKLKNAALNQQAPVYLRTVVVLLVTRQHIDYHHLMRLLIQLGEAARTDMLVPALNMRCLV